MAYNHPKICIICNSEYDVYCINCEPVQYKHYMNNLKGNKIQDLSDSEYSSSSEEESIYEIFCPTCGQYIGENECRTCEQQISCPQCKSTNVGAYCSSCGYKFENRLQKPKSYLSDMGISFDLEPNLANINVFNEPLKDVPYSLPLTIPDDLISQVHDVSTKQYKPKNHSKRCKYAPPM